MGGLTRTEILEPREFDRTNRVVVTNDGCGANQETGDIEQLPPVQKLPVREMNICKSYSTKPNNLREPRWHPARHCGNRKRQNLGPRDGVRAPRGQSINPAMKWLAIEMAAHEAWQCGQILRRFLHDEKIGPVLTDKVSDIFDARPHKSEQVPTDNFKSGGHSTWEGSGI